MQGNQDWFAQRRGRFTASRFGDLMKNGRSKSEMGETAKTYILQVAYETVTGQPIGFEGNYATEWGNEHEDEARMFYQGVSGNQVQEVGFCSHPRNMYAGGSPDGLVGIDGIIEIKCPFNGLNHAKNIIANEFFKSYEWQCQGNLWVTGRKWCDLISYDPRMTSKPIHIVRIERDEAMISLLEERIEGASNLLNEYLQLLNHKEQTNEL